MRFSRRRAEEPEINLIPFIDVLLVILIFLMLSTTYSRLTELQLTLPTADAQAAREPRAEVNVVVGADGRYAIDGEAVDGRSAERLAQALAAAARGRRDVVVVISADAMAAHQSVVNVLDAARRSGLARLSFATQAGGAGTR
jgi:biopolymer transport protein ExbD